MAVANISINLPFHTIIPGFTSCSSYCHRKLSNIRNIFEIKAPFYLQKNCCGGIFNAPWPYMENLMLHNKNRRTLWLRWMRGRLELTVPPYLATYWPVIHWESDWLCGGRFIASWWCWCKNCIMFSDPTHSAPSWIHDPLPCRTESLRASSQAAPDGDRQIWYCFPLHAPQQNNFHYSIITPGISIHICERLGWVLGAEVDNREVGSGCTCRNMGIS